MSKKERLFHAVLFEILAILISVLAVKLVSHYPTTETTFIILLISLIAVIWNMLFNWIFDLFFTAPRETRKMPLRLFHTILFEGGLLIFTLPMIVYVLNIGWLSAFLMDIGLTILILIYTFFFNLAYDHIRIIAIKKPSIMLGKN